MADAKTIVREQFNTGIWLIERCIADLTDEEYFKPAAPGTNHTAWILLHLARTEDWAMSALTGSEHRIPEDIRSRFEFGSTCGTDASKHPPRKEIDAMFREQRAHTMETLEASDLSTWDQPSPEGFPEFFPTVGSIWGMQSTHQFWHIGQLTTCRAVMKKKSAFS